MRSLGHRSAFPSKTTFTSIATIENPFNGENMRVETSPIPSVDMEGVLVPRLILGHLPFVGESYQGDERNKALAKTFSHVENTINVIAKAVTEYGVTAIAVGAASESRLSSLLLDAVRKVGEMTRTELSLLPCLRIPLTLDDKPIDDYRRWVTYYAFERSIVGDTLLRKYVEDPILLCRRGWAKRFPAAREQFSPYSKEEIGRLRINYEGLETALASFKGFKVLFAEAGSESDFLAMTGRIDLLEEFTHFLRTKLRCPVLLGLHHSGTSIPILEKSALDVVGYVTPVNPLGALMLPTQARALKAIKASGKPVIAIKPMAGGRVPPREAFEYVFNQAGVDASMIGVASKAEVDEDVPTALKALR
jgi:hypothetical protein